MQPERQETVIYGGAFNPPTRAHEAILQACVEYAGPRSADVWLLPSASRADKTIEVPREKRLAFCEALSRDVVRRTVELGIETMELDRPVQTETYDTVRELETRYPDRTFTWVFGADSVATMETWHEGVWLKEELSMLVINRPGAPQLKLGAKASLLAVDAGSLSSTELRRRILEEEPYEDMVGAHVYELLGAR
ncbi:nicotinate-nicotinamide nucleotide adenylyltransferase [Candidatus Saccharibacteria bacterium TM7i]|nr:nicotinate-nicotinamide nucleotide adenylyltransferase [Candidatus Saccharibacteria bacterium TM7i]